MPGVCIMYYSYFGRDVWWRVVHGVNFTLPASLKGGGYDDWL